MGEFVKAFWFVAVGTALTGCDTSTGGGSESNFVECTSTTDCASGFVCTAGTCQRPDASAAAGGAGGLVSTESGGTLGHGGAGGSGGKTGASGGNASVDLDAASKGSADAGDASQDGGAALSDGSAGGSGSLSEACFDVTPGACGALSLWTPAARAIQWGVVQATPIEGADGFATLLAHGSPIDSTVFATLGVGGGCAKPASPFLSVARRFAGVHRAVSRGGTLALVGECYQRFPCGSTLFVNGAEWVDPLGQALTIGVDVASDGRVLAVTSGYVLGDAATLRESVERWLSPNGQVLAERHLANVISGEVHLLEDGTIAVAASSASCTTCPNPTYVEFQSASLEDASAWNPGASRGILALGTRGPWLAVAGYDGNVEPWTGVVNAQTHTEVWSRTRTDLGQGEAVAVEVDATGTVDATVFDPNDSASFVLLHDTQTTPGVPTPTFVNGSAIGPSNGGMQTQSNGELLLTTDVAYTYCEKD